MEIWQKIAFFTVAAIVIELILHYLNRTEAMKNKRFRLELVVVFLVVAATIFVINK